MSPSVKRRGWIADLADLCASTLRQWNVNVTGSYGASIFFFLTVLSGVVNAAAALTPKGKPGESTAFWVSLSDPHLTLCLGLATLLWIGGCLFFALVHAWGNKHFAEETANARCDSMADDVKAKQREIDEKSSGLVSIRGELDAERAKNTPNLSGELAGQLLYDQGGERGVSIVMTVTIKNAPPSAPSAAYRYGIWVEKGDKRLRYLLEKLPKELPIGGTLPSGRTWTEVIVGADSIFEKTTEPIPAGGLKTGWAVAFLKDFKTREELHGARIVFEFFDIRGERHTIEWEADTQVISSTIPAVAGVSWSYQEKPAQANVISITGAAVAPNPAVGEAPPG
jgi:hypothetical protein